ncbi:hypothetical protein HYX19_04105 [Candidatus Woesearchaeota archaeon]|nr:hypothetical protein [Candidatus Woesearchaeota archaeon]
MYSTIITTIKEKKELSSLDDDFIRRMVDLYFTKNPKIKKKLEIHPRLEKAKEFEALLKEIRKTLHEVYGVFNLKSKEREGLLEKLEMALGRTHKIDNEVIELHKKILCTHQSTKERLNYYKKIYATIFKYTGRPSRILDLASGLNPFSYVFMDINSIEYTASEISSADIRFIQKYFKTISTYKRIIGATIKLDLIFDKSFPETEVCFLFKALDSLENIKKNISYEILSNIRAKYIAVSFPTRSLTGKNISKKRLSWFLKIVKRLGYSYETFEIPNELFYILKTGKIY